MRPIVPCVNNIAVGTAISYKPPDNLGEYRDVKEVRKPAKTSSGKGKQFTTKKNRVDM